MPLRRLLRLLLGLMLCRLGASHRTARPDPSHNGDYLSQALSIASSVTARVA
jgi:hypothetical protein